MATMMLDHCRDHHPLPWRPYEWPRRLLVTIRGPHGAAMYGPQFWSADPNGGRVLHWCSISSAWKRGVVSMASRRPVRQDAHRLERHRMSDERTHYPATHQQETHMIARMQTRSTVILQRHSSKARNWTAVILEKSIVGADGAPPPEGTEVSF